MSNDLEKELLKARLEIQKELIKKQDKKSIKSNKPAKNIVHPKKKISTKSIKELRSTSKKKSLSIDIRVLKTPLDLLFYNYDINNVSEKDSEVTQYLKFLFLLFNGRYKEANIVLDTIPDSEEKVFDEFLLTLFSTPKLAIQALAQKSSKLGKYKDVATFIVMAYVANDINLALKLAEHMDSSNLSPELKFLTSINSYFVKDNVIEIIPSIVSSLRQFPKNQMLHNLIGYVNLKKGDISAAKDYFLKSVPFTCACANLEDMGEDKDPKINCSCPKIFYLRIRKMLSIGEIDAAKKIFESFKINHPYKFLSYYYLFGSDENNDSVLLKFEPTAKFYFKSRLLATVALKSMKLISSYKEALSKKLNLSIESIDVEVDFDNYEFLYQVLGGLYCKLMKNI